MSEYQLGDEEYSEEINTSYDQDQEIGDSPQALYTEPSNAEPIDAQTGQDFLDIDVGQESLNKDGTGVQRATRGVNPNVTPLKFVRFVYVSKSDCPTCKQYDGKTFAIDDPNRPIIPRMEHGGKGAIYTHPHCKCKWVNVFSDAESLANEDIYDAVFDDLSDKQFEEYTETPLDEKTDYLTGVAGAEEVSDAIKAKARVWAMKNGINYDTMSKLEKGIVHINYLKNEIAGESEEADEFDLDPVPLASMAKMAFDTIAPSVKTKLGMEGKLPATENEKSVYGIQNLLDSIVNKSLGKEDKEEIEEILSEDFVLPNLLNLIADKLSKKVAKKLGIEARAKENDKPLSEWTKDDLYKSECQSCGSPMDEHPNVEGEEPHEFLAEQPVDYEGDQSPAFEGDGDYWRNLDEEDKEKIISNHDLLIGEEDGWDWDLLSPEARKKIREIADEGGKGSGKAGHQQWMLGTELAEECPHCQMATEYKDGKCTICGN